MSSFINQETSGEDFKVLDFICTDRIKNTEISQWSTCQGDDAI